jgi:hypothetical protein
VAVSGGDGHATEIVTTVPSRWDWAALRAGAGVALMFAIPITILASIVDDSGLSGLFFFGAWFGFVLGAGCAAWVQRSGTPMSHALVTAGGTYLLAQAVFVTVRLITDDEVRWFAVTFTFSFVLLAGLTGGFLGSRLQAKGYHPSMHSGDQRGGR